MVDHPTGWVPGQCLMFADSMSYFGHCVKCQEGAQNQNISFVYNFMWQKMKLIIEISQNDLITLFFANINVNKISSSL